MPGREGQTVNLQNEYRVCSVTGAARYAPTDSYNMVRQLTVASEATLKAKTVLSSQKGLVHGRELNPQLGSYPIALSFGAP